MKITNMFQALSIFLIMLLQMPNVLAENIDPYDDGSQYAYGENVGWINFEPNLAEPNIGAQVAPDKLTGFIWAENIGWISLSCENTSSCGTVNYGVTNDGTGFLSGYAWSPNVGWINFNPKVPGDPNHYGVTVDHIGHFAGWAWGQNIGWIHLASSTPVAYKVQTSWITSCVVDFDDLGKFCNLWLQTGPGLNADFNASNDVNFKDYSTIADLWFQLCPPGWPLK